MVKFSGCLSIAWRARADFSIVSGPLATKHMTCVHLLSASQMESLSSLPFLMFVCLDSSGIDAQPDLDAGN